ncbi:MAG: DUF2961 domain-containing protein [Acidobacteriota bacterium]
MPIPPAGRRFAVAAAALLSAGALLGQSSVTGPIDPLAFSQFKDVEAHRSSSNNPDWNSNDDSKHPIAGETVTIADLRGPGIVTHLWITIAAREYGWPRLLRLRVYYDGSSEASVDSPIGDFFAVGHGFERPVNSLMVRDGSGGRARNSYWPMPFRKSCRITVTNEGSRRVNALYYHVDWEKVRSLPAATAYFHARYRQELPARNDGRPYLFLDVTGRGFYVGTVLSVVQAEAGWFGEGDEHFFVDGEKTPSIEGTGSEDYFNDAWGLHVEEGPYFGVPVAEGTGLGSRMTGYRWHLTDPVPFTKSLRFDIEHKGWTYNPDGSVKSAFGERTDVMSSVAFWYQDGVATGLWPVPYGAARLAQGNQTQIEVTLSNLRAEKGKISVSNDIFWPRDTITFAGEGPGSRVEVQFDVPVEGDYELYSQMGQAPEFGTYEVLVDGKSPSSAVLEHEPGADVRPRTRFDGYAGEGTEGVAYPIGSPHLTKGRHSATFVCVGRSARASGFGLQVDDLVLAQTGAAGWARAAAVRPPAVPSDLPGLRAALEDPDPVLRGLAALGLREKGVGARLALEALVLRLKDSDPGVRMMSAQAIASIGAPASSAIPALAAASLVPGESAHVLASCADALGAMGKAAVPALPALREMRKAPRARWAADRAIARIEDVEPTLRKHRSKR